MTDAEWVTSADAERILTYLGHSASVRKLRHFLVACSRRVLPEDPDKEMVEALEVSERFADGSATKSGLSRARASLKTNQPYRVSRWAPLYTNHIRSVPAWHATREQVERAAREGARCCAWASTRKKSPDGTVYMAYPGHEFEAQAALLRDIFGNPFRPVTFDPNWRTTTAIQLAQQMYDSRDFSAMPILADALEDAGCDNADILDHCRGSGPHVRGCWVVDLVLGKS